MPISGELLREAGALAALGLNFEEFFTGPEFLTVLAQFISSILTTFAVQILGQALGQPAA